MSLKKVIIYTFISVFFFNSQVAYSKNINDKQYTYTVDKNTFIRNENPVTNLSQYSLLTEEQKIQEQELALDSMYKSGLLFPGLGHLMFEDYLKGSLLMGIGIGLLSMGVYGVSPAGNGWGILLYTFPSIIYMMTLYFISGIDLSMIYNKKDREIHNITKNKEEYEAIERTYLLNIYVPGLGSLMSGDFIRGGIYSIILLGILTYSILNYNNSNNLLSFISIPYVYIASLIDSTLKYNFDRKELKNIIEISGKESTYNNNINQNTSISNQNVQILSQNFKF